jgi:hypothetical protein
MLPSFKYTSDCLLHIYNVMHNLLSLKNHGQSSITGRGLVGQVPGLKQRQLLLSAVSRAHDGND